jgi:periplasmic protein TonB
MEDIMAYADNKDRPSGSSIGGALLINGLMITGIIFAVPDIIPERFRPTTIITIPKTPPPPDPIRRTKVDPKRRTVPTESVAQRPQQDLSEASHSSDAEAGYSSGGELTGQGTGGTIETTIKIEPVFKSAQVNPRFTGALQPAYPPGMIREEREGVVTVRILIGIDGRVRAVEPIKADEAQFLEATRKQALSKWRFLPATRDGMPVESWREMTVRFELPD